MKKAIIASALLPMAIVAAQGFYQSSSSQSSASSAGLYSSRGGAIGVGNSAYALQPGQSLEVSSGVRRFSSTIQQPGQMPVTTTIVEEQPAQAFINGVPVDVSAE